jgi:hypothetical protein
LVLTLARRQDAIEVVLLAWMSGQDGIEVVLLVWMPGQDAIGAVLLAWIRQLDAIQVLGQQQDAIEVLVLP